MVQLKTGKTYKDAKVSLYKLQGGLCPLCNKPLVSVESSHLDHDHALTGANAGKVRGLLHSGCNRCEGKFGSWFKRFGMEGGGVDFPTFLRNLATYLENDYSNNDFHPQYVTDMAAWFNRQNLKAMKEVMREYGYEYNESDKKADLTKKFKKQFRERNI